MELEKYICNRLATKPICMMTHVIAGYPSFDDNMAALEIMAENDVDIVEIQMPFSEPSADGAVFVKANQEALKAGVTTKKYFSFMKKAAQTFDFPLLMMGYYNTVFKMGENKFLDSLQEAGGKGFIIPDLPIEEGLSFYKSAKTKDLAPITFASPNTPAERLKRIGEIGCGFVYVVARSGVTGKQTNFNEMFEEYIKRCHESIDIPLAVGFGITNKNDIEYLVGKVDIAIIGTALLKAWENEGAVGLRNFFSKLR